MSDSVTVQRGPEPWVPCEVHARFKKGPKPPPAMFLVGDVPVCPFHLIEACTKALSS